MNLKKVCVLASSTLFALYVLFLVVPFFLTGMVNSYNDKISEIVEASTGFKLKVDNIRIITTPKLTVGARVGEVRLMLPTGEEILSAENAEARLSLIPLIIKNIEIDVIKAEELNVSLAVQPDGRFAIEKYASEPVEMTENTAIQTPMTGLPLGLKLSNHLPDIRVENYNFVLSDMRNNKQYSLNGKKFMLTDFILNKKFKVSTSGSLCLDDEVPFTYDVRVVNKVMPDIDLNDIVFGGNNTSVVNTQSNGIEFNVIDVLEGIKKEKLKASLIADVKISGTLDDVNVEGFIDIENLSVAVNGKSLPEGHIKTKLSNKKAVTDIYLYTDENELTSIISEYKGGKSKNINLSVKSNAQINNIFNILKTIAASFNYHDLDSLTATGAIDADFNVKSNMKKVASAGYFKIPLAVVNYPLYNILIDNINMDVDFSGDTVNLENLGFTILSQPLKAYGTIKTDASVDLHLTAEKLLLKGLLASAGQIGLLKENDIKSGTLSMDANLTGKLNAPKPTINVAVDNVNVLNIPSSTSVKLEEAKVNLVSDGKNYKGDILADSVKIVNPAAAVTLPKVSVTLNDKDVNIADTYLLIDNSRFDISGKVSDYTTKNLSIDISAKGNLAAEDVRSMIPADIRSMVTAKGSMPVLVTVTGNDKKQIIDAALLATPSGYLHLLDIDSLSGKSSLIRSKLAIADNSLLLADTGLFSTSKTSLPVGSESITPLVNVSGAVNNLTKPYFNNLKIETPYVQNISIPGFNKSKAEVNANIVLNGDVVSPLMKGKVSAKSVSLPEIKTTLDNIEAVLSEKAIDVTLPSIKVDNSAMSAKAVVSSNFSNGITVKSVDFNGSFIDADTLMSAFAGLPSTSPATASGSSISGDGSAANGNLGVVIQKGNGSVAKFKTGQIVATNLTSEFGLKNNVFYLKNLKGDSFLGKINGNINCNVISGLTGVDLSASGMNAVDAIDAAAGIPNALSGTLAFNAKLKLNAFASDFNAMMKSVTGDVTFDVQDGHYANIGRLDNLLLAQNLTANAILKAALAPIRNLPVVQNTSEFKTITGTLTLANGIANLKTVKSAGPSMAYFVTGYYNILNGYTNVIILGRLGADVVAALGVLGDLSVSKLTSYIPKFGTQTANILSALTSNPETEKTDEIPLLTDGDTNTKDFKVIFTGNVTNASSIKSFKWLSTCDISEITGGSLKEQLKTTTEALKTNHQNNVEAVKQNVEEVKDAARNTVEEVKNQIQNTKDSINELKNLFKKQTSTESENVEQGVISD